MAAGFEEGDKMAWRTGDGPPWHRGSGYDVEIPLDVINAETMQRAAGLDWSVEKWAVYAFSPIEIPKENEEIAIDTLVEVVGELASHYPAWGSIPGQTLLTFEEALSATYHMLAFAYGAINTSERPKPAVAPEIPERGLAITAIPHQRAIVRPRPEPSRFSVATLPQHLEWRYTPLGVTSPTFRPYQNQELFALVEALLGVANLTFVTAGSLGGGKRIWVLARYRDDLDVIPGDSLQRVQRYLMVTNGHDGSSALRCCFTGILVVCQNTLAASLNGADAIYSARHTAGMQHDRLLAEARVVLDVGARAFTEQQHLLQALLTVQYSMEQFIALAKTIWPATILNAETGELERSPQADRNIEELCDAFLRSPGNEVAPVANTAYAALQAFTYWATHSHAPRVSVPEGREDVPREELEHEARMKSIFFGGHGQSTVARARTILLQQAEALGAYYPLTAEELEGAAEGVLLMDLQSQEHADAAAAGAEDCEEESEEITD